MINTPNYKYINRLAKQITVSQILTLKNQAIIEIINKLIFQRNYYLYNVHMIQSSLKLQNYLRAILYFN